MASFPYIALLAACSLTGLKSIAQSKPDTTTPQEMAALIEASKSSDFRAYYLLDSFSKANDSLNAGKQLMKVSPYYLWYLHDVKPDSLDFFLSTHFQLTSDDRKKYKQTFIKAFNEVKPQSYNTFRFYCEEDQEMRKLSGIPSKITALSTSKAMRYSDSIHFKYLYDFVKKNGWPRIPDGGLYANVIAVHDHEHHKFYLPFIRKAVLKGQAPLSLLQLISHWQSSILDRKKLLNDLRTKEYARIDISSILQIDTADYFKLHMPSDSTLSQIASMSQKLCPLDYYFTHENADTAQKWWSTYYRYKTMSSNTEIGKIQKIVIDNSCYDNDPQKAERDMRTQYYKNWYMSNFQSETKEDKCYLYLVSNRPKKTVDIEAGTIDTFSVFFETDAPSLTVNQQVRLQAIMIDSIGMKDSISIIGYADITGQSAANKILSQKRAENIRDYLQGNGIGKQYFKECTGLGAVSREDGTREYPKDRRVDIIVLHPGKLNRR